MSGAVRLDVAGRIATLTLDHPDKLNAFSGDMREQLRDALDALAARADVHVVAITGAGRAFCTGGDVGHMVALQERGAAFEELLPLLERGAEILTAIAALPMPVIAAVNGVAAGAGMNLALACDVRLASNAARFGETFVRIGLHPDWGGTHTLPRLVGLAHALDLCWTGAMVDADEALRLGLVQRVWPAAEFDAGWRGYVAALADAPQASVRGSKRTLRAGLRAPLEQALAAEVAAQRACWASPDAREGLTAFVEKRPPRFGGAPPAPRDGSRAGQRFE